MSGENIEKPARAFAASDPDDTYGVGVIVGYCPVAAYKIRRQDGTEFWWRTDLTEIVGPKLAPDSYPPRAKKDSHFIIMKSDLVDGSMEAVCYCGALFRSTSPLYGTVGELFAAHIRGIRARENGVRSDEES